MAKGTDTTEAPKKARKTRTKVDASKMDPLDAQVYRLKQAHRIVKIGMLLDRESCEIAIKLLTDLHHDE